MGEVELVSGMVRRVVNLMGVSISPIITVKLPCERVRCGGREGGREGDKQRNRGQGRKRRIQQPLHYTKRSEG